jgi:curved DNA-binding protein CbpA
LLSRIDSMMTERDLALITGLPPATVAGVLDRLLRAGAIEFLEPVPDSVRSSRDGPPSSRMAASGHSAGDPGSTSPPLYDPAELDEPVDLDPEKKRRILDLYYRLDDLTYYELLGVGEQADKKQVKSAYYASAPEFHPDKHFRKNLGSYKQKIEAVFGRMTLAHDVLTAVKRRAEYDEYLETTHKNRAMSAMLEQAPRDVAAVVAAVEQAASAALRDVRPGQPGRYEAISAANDASRHQDAASTPPVRAVAPTPAAAADELRLRKEALARKLMGGNRRPGPAPAAAAPLPRPAGKPVEMDPELAARAAEALQRRHEAAIADARRQQVGRYMETGRAALERQDFAGAANAYRIAASLEPDDPKVQATCNEAMQLAAAALADGYWKQAVYEEGQERWAEAALSYSKVCAGKPHSAEAFERVAFTTLKSSTNVRRAVEFARKAVELAPSTPEMRVTLARTYAAASLWKSANGELDRAMELAPQNPKIQAMAAQVRALAPKDGKVS